MLSFFPKQTVSIPSFPDEQWSITRVGRGKTSDSINNKFQALIPKATNIAIGNLVSSDGKDYFVLTKEKSFVNTVCQLKKANATIDILRVTKHFTASKVNDYDYEVPLHTEVTVFYEEISGKMQQYDLGLSPKSTKKFLVPKIPITLLDRIRINGTNACVEVINESSYPGLLSIQTSVDNRPTKNI